ICHKFLGLGLDHPWIDISKVAEKGYLISHPKGRAGKCTAAGEDMKEDALSSAPLLKELLALVQSMECMKRAPGLDLTYRYLRKHLPDTDFAYTIEDCNWGPSPRRYHGLAMNRKARDLLKSNRILTDKECKPVLILDQPPKGVENLDEKYGPADPA